MIIAPAVIRTGRFFLKNSLVFIFFPYNIHFVYIYIVEILGALYKLHFHGILSCIPAGKHASLAEAKFIPFGAEGNAVDIPAYCKLDWSFGGRNRHRRV
jgi:hypothetical protein